MAIFIVYRKRLDETEWHCHTQCPEWPAYVQKVYREPGDRICTTCVKLERDMNAGTLYVKSSIKRLSGLPTGVHYATVSRRLS